MIVLDNIEPRAYYTIAELSHFTNTPYSTLSYHLRLKNLHGFKPKGGRQWKIKGLDFKKWLNDAVEL